MGYGKNGGSKKSFPKGPSSSPSVNKTNPTGGSLKYSDGFRGRATNPTEKPVSKKGNP